MATFNNPSKHAASITGYLRHGNDSVLSDMQNFTFTTVVFQDGTQLKDITFQQLQDQVWSLIQKHNASLTSPAKN